MKHSCLATIQYRPLGLISPRELSGDPETGGHATRITTSCAQGVTTLPRVQCRPVKSVVIKVILITYAGNCDLIDLIMTIGRRSIDR